MIKFVYIVFFAFFAISFTSCGSMTSAHKASQNEVAGYTLKNKKEIMEQKILNKTTKTIITTP